MKGHFEEMGTKPETEKRKSGGPECGLILEHQIEKNKLNKLDKNFKGCQNGGGEKAKKMEHRADHMFLPNHTDRSNKR